MKVSFLFTTYEPNPMQTLNTSKLLLKVQLIIHKRK